MNFADARHKMIEQQIRPWSVHDDHLLSLMENLARETFVPPSYRNLAYADIEIPLNSEVRELSPKVMARLLQAASLKGADTVLEVGGTTGYMTALIAMQVKKVVCLQADPTLYANTLLRLQPYHNIELRCASGVEAVQDAVPFDAIIVNGALAEVPEVLLQQLAPGGRLLAILGSPPIYSACRIVREPGGGFEHERLFETSALPLKGFQAPSRFRF